ncbi:MAG: hypothetical protein ACR2GY_11220 [Phycisphaerales bacterium]
MSLTAGNHQSPEALANRLRMIQLDFADEPAEQRQAFLTDELTRALREVPPDERNAYLDSLASHFPTWDGGVEVGDRSTLQSTVDRAELSDASFLISRLIEISPTLSDRERQVIRDRLASAGLAETAPMLDWRSDASAALGKELGVAATTGLDPSRALDTIDLLVTCLGRLEKLTHKTWQEIAPREKLKEQGRLGRNLARFYSGDTDVSREQIAEDLERLRGLVASMIFAIKTAPREWAHRHLERYAPPAIEAAVAQEGVGFLGKREVKCWEKYQELARDLDQVVMTQEILAVVAEFASRILESGKS